MWPISAALVTLPLELQIQVEGVLNGRPSLPLSLTVRLHVQVPVLLGTLSSTPSLAIAILLHLRTVAIYILENRALLEDLDLSRHLPVSDQRIIDSDRRSYAYVE